MEQKIIDIQNGVTRHPLYRMAEPVNLSLVNGEQIAIVGRNASGKSLLVDILTGAHPLLGDALKYNFAPAVSNKAYDNIRYMTFRDSYGDNVDGSYYYQQRWNQHDIDENTPVVGTILQEAYDLACAGDRKTAASIYHDDAEAQERYYQACVQQRDALRKRLYEVFHIELLLDKYVILLSSGELRKFLLTKTLLSNPRVLILDNPFIGLDVQARDQVKTLLRDLIGMGSIMVILVLSKTNDIPDFITHIIPVADRRVGEKVTREAYLQGRAPFPDHVLEPEKYQSIIDLPYKEIPEDFAARQKDKSEVVTFNNVCIKYGTRTILKDLNWAVRSGEHWALSGENGSGKSTLLSLVCADNPQAYACDIVLFGHQRGRGETIWEIKKYIGYVSPEMHRAYLKDLPAIDIVASGLHDSVGLYVRPKPEQRGICAYWMDIFGIGHVKDQTFLKLSTGEQRLCLLARAFVKDPELLILDEPLHGLDDYNRRRVKDVIEAFCHRHNKTMVMVTHYQEELPNCITNKICLKKNA